VAANCSAEAEEREVYLRMKRMAKRSYAQLNFFQDNIAHGRPNEWRCRSGARYLYICEDGLVHYCAQQRGYPAKPLEQYTVETSARVSNGKSLRAALHGCLLDYTSYMDFWRGPQTLMGPAERAESDQLVQLETR